MKFSIISLILTFIFYSVYSSASSQGEVKILYSCDSLESIPHEDKVKGSVTFLETRDGRLYTNGLIIRIRKNQKEEDITIKKRWESKPIIDEQIEVQLSQSRNGELKCEADFNYDENSPRSVESCSFKSDGVQLLKEHSDFLKMVKSPIKEIPSNLLEINLSSFKWKIPISGFIKRPNLEMWKKENGQCLLEASAKFENNDSHLVLRALRNAIKATPLALQFSKTGWALGVSKR